MAVYYIRPGGSDAADGLSHATAWQNPDVKITGGSFSPGDRFKFERGYDQYAHFTPPSSGSAGNPIIFESYGSGSDPKCRGDIAASGWNDEGGNIHSFQHASMTQDPKSVTFDGVLKPRGKSQYFVITARTAEGVGSYVETLADPALPAIDYTGTQIVIRNSQYIFRAWPISSKSGVRVNYTSDITGMQAYTPTVGNGFFIQNHLSLLVADGDWMYDEATDTLYMYFADDDPDAHTVNVAVRQQVIDASNRNYIEILGIDCIGSISHGINRYNTSHVNTNGCEVAFCGDDGICNLDYASSYCLDTNNVVHDCHSNGIYSNFFCHHMEATYNQVYNCGLHPGASLAAGNHNSKGNGIVHQYGAGNKANNNRVWAIGHNGISVNGNGFEKNDNIVSQCCLLKGDGACLYTSQAGVTIGGVQQYLTVAGSIRRNICIGSTGNMVGIFDPTPLLFCCYMDDLQNLVEIENNLFANCAGAGLYLHNTDEITVRYNTFYGNTRPLNLSQDGGNTLRNTVFKYNHFYLNGPDQFLVSCLATPGSDVSLFGDFDENDYHYIENHLGLFEVYGGDKYNYGLSFSEWQTAIGGEALSTCVAYQNHVPADYTAAATLWTQSYPSDGSQSGSSGGQFTGFAGGTRTWSAGKAVLTKTSGGKQDAYMAIGAIEAATKYVMTVQVDSAAEQFLSLIPESSFNIGLKRKRIQAPATPQTYQILFDNLTADASDQMLWLMESDFASVNVDNVALEKLTDFTFESDIELIYNSGTASEDFTFDTNRKNLETNVVALSFSLEPGEFAVLQKTTEPLTPVEGTVIYVYAKLTIV